MPQRSSANQFAMMRVESNRAPGIFNQLRVALLHGLTCKLFSLYYQIEAIKSELEVRCALLFILQSIMVPQLKVDKQQLNDTETVTGAEVPSPVGKRLDIFLAVELTSDASLMVPSATATPMINHVNEPTLPLPATVTMMP